MFCWRRLYEKQYFFRKKISIISFITATRSPLLTQMYHPPSKQYFGAIMIDIQHLVCKFSVYQSSTFTESDVFSFTNYVELKRYCPCCFAPFSLFALQRFGLECIQNSYSRKKHLRTKIRFIRIMVITRAVPMIVSN